MLRPFSDYIDFLRQHRRTLRQAGLAVAVVVFAGGLLISLRSAPDLISQAKILPFLVVLLVIQPVGSAVSIAEFWLLARMSGARVNWPKALQIVIYARAASFLPIPGSFITRVAALKMHDIPVVRASMTTTMVIGLRGAVAFCYSGVWLLIRGDRIGFVFVAVGAVGLLTCAVVSVRLHVHFRLVALAATLFTFGVMVEATSLVWAGKTFGIALTFDQTSVFVVSTFVATVAAIAPGGLGVREAVIALLSPVVGIDPSSGFLTAAAGRAAHLLGMAVTATIVYLTTLRTVRSSP